MWKDRMVDLIPEGEKGVASVTHFNVTKEQASLASLQYMMTGQRPIEPGDYARLVVDGKLMMTDTYNEKATNSKIVRNANGDVLIAGLGIGMVLVPVLRNSDVRSVTVIEKYQDVIDLVEPHVRKAVGDDSRKLTVVNADIFKWKFPKSQKWDTIYFDIWPDICTDNLDEIQKLNRRFALRLNRDNPRAWRGAWEEESLRYTRARERRFGG